MREMDREKGQGATELGACCLGTMGPMQKPISKVGVAIL
jgi:hypothetical protein